MRKFKDYYIGYESTLDQHNAGRYNPCLEIYYKDYVNKLQAGGSDFIDAYYEGEELFVLTTNFRLAYVGLEIFKNGELVGDVFFQDLWQIKEAGVNLKMAPFNIIKRLAEYIY
ncbi:hypothetical protein HQ584_01710 [Patescibacteria group bacterium]|nr:hypothetical protein [Patescibacteria group bacterium]